ncbi:putative NB-ARC domain-containing protein [Seiridium unicorne]|uniref:NB-ARC domain-containing protein n=1 Tax=Seiridium unicorne TaxID=138068 RepID=A0ABR2UZM5_9PEZI
MFREVRPGNPQQAWAAAIARTQRELGGADFQTFLGTRDYATCIANLTAANNAFSKKWARVKAIISPFFDFLNTFDRALGTCCQSSPEIACLIWGSIQAVLSVASKFAGVVHRIAFMLQKIPRCMPRFEDYSRFFPQHERLHLCLVDIYETFVLFCVRAFKFLRSRSFTIVVRTTWQSLDKVFEDAVEQFKAGTADLEREARAANIQIGFEREEAAERRYQNVMAAVPNLLNNTKLTRPTMLVPLDRNPAFFGRTKELSTIQAYTSRTPAVEERKLKTVAIRAIGGMGKTQLALEFIFRERLAFKGIFWIRSEESIVMQQDFAQIGRTIASEKSTGANLEKSVQFARDWLSETGGSEKWISLTCAYVFLEEPWLIVFDNVEDSGIVLDLWPNSGSGTIIITTRDDDVANRLAESKIELEGFQPDEGAALLRLVEPNITNPDLARCISHELGGLPLALCQMGSYIRQTRCNLADFLRTLQNHSERLYRDKASTRSLQYANNIATCCDLSFKQLPREGFHLLAVLAFFQTDEIQEALLTHGCSTIPRLQHLSGFLEWNNAVRMLTKNGLIERFETQHGHVIRIHRVIKRHVLHDLGNQSPPLRQAALQDAIDLLNQKFPQRPPDGGTMSKHWRGCELWLPHVISLKDAFTWIRKVGENIPRAYTEILVNCSYYMWERGSRNATAFTTHALRICEESLGNEGDPLLADVLTVRGALKMTESGLEKRGECADLFKRALHTRQLYMRVHPGPSRDDTRQLANAYHNMGVTCLTLEEWDDALPCFERSLQLKKTVGNEDSIPYDFAISFYNMCKVQIGKGSFDQALPMAKKAASLAERANGVEDYRTSQFRFAYAELLLACGRVSEGLEIHEMTLEIRERVMGMDNNDSGVSYYALSCAYQRLGRLNEALMKIKQAVKVFDGVPNAEDRMSRAYFRKHLIMRELGDDTGARMALSKAREIRHSLVVTVESDEDTIEDYDSMI